MIGAPAEKAGLARDTVFAAVMIVCNGIVGLCLLWGGARHHEQGFQVHGASAALAVLAALTVLTLVLPNVTTSTPGPSLAKSQLIFEGIVSLVLYASFVFVQTVRHRDYFLPVGIAGEEAHAPPPSNTTAVVSAGLLLTALVAVVGLAKSLTPTLEMGVARVDVPKAVVGIVIAGLVLLPEGLARISHTTECIGVANQRKPLRRNNSSSIRGAPRCRQSVAQISLDLNLLKAARW
jgi:Ca2+:H+ antiporter